MPESIGDAQPSAHPPNQPQDKCSNILETIGKHHLLHATTLEPNFTWNDFLIPFTLEQLPEDENRRLDYTANFTKQQEKFLSEISPQLIQNILTRRSEEGEPPHIHTTSISEEIEVGKSLGHGRWGEVLEVKLKANHDRSNSFAMKRMRKPAPRDGNGVLRCTVSEFETELRHLSKCRHHHIIDLRASFTDETNFGFIVWPVASLTLQKLLDNYVTQNHIDEHHDIREALSIAFGCLLSAVHYLHEELEIRHRDIKPRNILMHHNQVLICDLGSAYDFEPLDRNESTDSRRPPGTQKYKAPEVLASINPGERQSHNTKVDIFSLGCVFLEMHTVLNDQTLNQMTKFITQNEANEFDRDWTYASSLEKANLWLDKLCDDQGLGEGLTELIRSMVRLKPRPLKVGALTRFSSSVESAACE